MLESRDYVVNNLKKVLVLTPRFPFPVIGGDKLRIYKLCEALSKDYEIILLSLCESKCEMSMSLPDSFFSEVHRVYHPKWKSWLSTMLAIPTSTPLQVAYYRSKSFRKKIDILSEHCDITLSHLIRVGDYTKDFTGVNILEMTDAISMNYKRVSQNASLLNFKAWIYRFEQRRLERYERDIRKSFSLVTLVSDVDRRYLFSNEGDNILVCGNGVDLDKLPFVDRSNNLTKTDQIKLVFIGNMRSMQNMDAVRYFVKAVLPLLNRDGDFLFKVIGLISERDREWLSKQDNVIVTGPVDNIAKAAEDGHIGICPVRLGAGIQNKILEYMSLGLPCVSSEVGFEGLGAIDGKEIIVAKNPNEYCAAIIALQSDVRRYRELAEAARFFVQNKYSWSSKLSPFVSTVASLTK